MKELSEGKEVKINNVDEEKFLSNIGLLSIKPKIIVCNVDEESLGKGNDYTDQVKKKYPNEKIINIENGNKKRQFIKITTKYLMNCTYLNSPNTIK